MAEDKKKCRYCGVERANMAEHIINRHPSVLEKIEESILEYPSNSSQAATSPTTPPTTTPQRQSTDIGTLIREKLDLMLNIKIIEMLSKSPNVTLQELNQAVNPPQQTSLKELVQFHKEIYGDQEKEPPYIETGNKWVDIAQQAIPIVKDMLQSRKQPQEVDQNVRRGEKTNPGILKPIQLKIAGDPAKPDQLGKEPGAPGDPEQQDHRGNNPA